MSAVRVCHTLSKLKAILTPARTTTVLLAAGLMVDFGAAWKVGRTEDTFLIEVMAKAIVALELCLAWGRLCGCISNS